MRKIFLYLVCYIALSHAQAQSWEELGSLAFQYHKAGFYNEAILYAQSAIDVARKQYGETDLRYISSVINMGNYLRDSPKPEHQQKASKYYLEALDFFKKYQKGHTLEGTANFNYGLYLEKFKQDPKPYYQRAYQIYLKRFGEQHPLTQAIRKKL